MDELVYKFKDKPYRIIEKSKIKLNGIWEDVIIYECLYDNPDGMHWVRLIEDFYTNFKVDKK